MNQIKGDYVKRGTDAKVAIIGAGPSGITAAKHLIQVGISNLVVFEKNNQVGGNWVYSPDPSHSSVYESTHIISSKKFSQYHDFPMPDDYPDYPGHKLLLKYFQDYATHFGVDKYIKFNTTVNKTKLNADQTWTVETDNGEDIFDYLIIANGHHWDPRYPNYPGEFTGEYLHSHLYRTHFPFKDKRVLIIGGGNSACDITVDICRHASYTGLSWRRGYYVVPKFMMGSPPDQFIAKMRWLPEVIQRTINRISLRIMVGKYSSYGLPNPDHKLLSSHPIANSQLLYYLRHGEIHPKPDVERFEGKMVHFKDGSTEEYDTIVVATGYKISFPFLEEKIPNFTDIDVPLYMRMYTPKFPTMVIIGLVQPQGCIWPLSDTQAQVFANYIVGNYDFPENVQDLIDKELREHKKKYVESPRHSTEVNYHKLQKQLFKAVPKSAPKWSTS